MSKSGKQRTDVRKRTNPNEGNRRAEEPLSRSSTEKDPPEELDAGLVEDDTEKNETQMQEYADISEESSSIISIVRDLEGQVETAFALKEAMEADLSTTQKKLSEALAARNQLETQVKSLKAQSALAEQLREDLAFTEEERNKFANLLAETKQQLGAVSGERDSLAKETGSMKSAAKQLEGEKTALEAQVMNLKDNVSDMERMRTDLAEITEERQRLTAQVKDLSRRLKAAETSKNSLEKTGNNLRGEVDKLRGKLTDADSRVVALGLQIEEQQAANSDLVETRAHLESEIKMLNINYEAATKELKSLRNVLIDIRSEAARTSGRVRQRYFKSKDKE